jgi:hypothetical protein
MKFFTVHAADAPEDVDEYISLNVNYFSRGPLSGGRGAV